MKDTAQEFEDQVTGLCIWQMLKNPRTESEIKEDDCYWSSQNQPGREGNKQEMGRSVTRRKTHGKSGPCGLEGQRALP